MTQAVHDAIVQRLTRMIVDDPEIHAYIAPKARAKSGATLDGELPDEDTNSYDAYYEMLTIYRVDLLLDVIQAVRPQR